MKILKYVIFTSIAVRSTYDKINFNLHFIFFFLELSKCYFFLFFFFLVVNKILLFIVSKSTKIEYKTLDIFLQQQLTNINNTHDFFFISIEISNVNKVFKWFCSLKFYNLTPSSRPDNDDWFDDFCSKIAPYYVLSDSEIAPCYIHYVSPTHVLTNDFNVSELTYAIA